MIAVEFRNVSYEYPGGFRALNDLSLEVRAGHIYGILGPNGAGKSTAFRILMGLMKPHRGEALIGGSPIRPEESTVYSNVGFVPDTTDIFDHSTPVELLKFFGRCQGMDALTIRQRTEELLSSFRLESLANKRIREFSKGMKQKVHVMRAMIHSPKILVLDEPASNLDPAARMLLLDILRAEKKKETTIVISSHILPELEGLCDEIAIFSRGSVRDSGRVEELMNKYQFEEARYKVRLTGGMAKALDCCRRWERELRWSKLDDETVQVILNPTSGEVPRFLEVLVRAGAKIIDFSVQRKDLENIYIEIVGSHD